MTGQLDGPKLDAMSSNYALLDEPANWTAFSTPSPQNKTSDKEHGLWQSQVVVEGMH